VGPVGFDGAGGDSTSRGPFVLTRPSSPFTSSTICWQKPQPEFQNSRIVSLPRNPSKVRSGSRRAGTGSPDLVPAGAAAPFPFAAGAASGR
jgi:hypothetical protein